MSKIRVFLADDHPIVREGLKLRLGGRAEVVGEAGEGQEVLEQVQKTRPDIVFMDVVLAGMNGLEVTRRLQQELPQARVIVLTAHADRAYALQALRAGARGYLLKDAPAAEMGRALEAVLRGERFFPPGIYEQAMQQLLDEETRPRPELSEREREVLILIAQGCSNKEAADRLNISPRTVETHRKHLMDKLDIHTVAGLTQYALAKSLIVKA